MAPQPSFGKQEDDSVYRFTKIYTILSFSIVILGIGLPVWWTTTRTYRVALPYERIQYLAKAKWTYKTNINVVVSRHLYEDVSKIKSLLYEDDDTQENRSTEKIVSLVHYTIRPLSSTESKFLDKNHNLEEIIIQWHKQNLLSRVDEVTVIVLPIKIVALPTNITSYISRHRLFFVQETRDISSFISEIKINVETFFVQQSILKKTLLNVVDPQRIKPDKRTLWTLRATPTYDVTFSLAIPEPGKVLAHWDIKKGINVFLKPLIDKLAEVVKFNIQSQVFYFLPLGVKPMYDESKKCHYLTLDQLPHIINPLEVKLGSHVTIHPSLNFLVYLPAEKELPLYIYDESGERSPINAFSSPRWGGIFIHNFYPQKKNSSELLFPYTVTIDMQQTMEIFISELRLFLGLDFYMANLNVKFQELDGTFLRDWELDHLMRRRVLENLATATNTLKSLASLLEEIENIVINDEVGSYVFKAVEAIGHSERFLRTGMLKEALSASTEAYVASENAFFDPSMLALLYFPEDQKYAVYVPLFLPVSVPVILSLIHVFKMWRERKSKAKTD